MKTKDKELIDLENAVSNEQLATDDNLGKNEKTMTDNNAVKSDNDKKFGIKKNKEKKAKATESKEENTKTEDGETDEVVADAVEGENKDKPKSKARTATKRIAFSAVFMALIIVFTSFIKVPIGVSGYVHMGDLMIYLCASTLPLPYALVAAGVGGAVSDVIAGYPAWAPFTLVIKMLLVVCFTNKKDTVLCVRNYIAAAICLVITMVGYFFSEVILYGSWGAYVGMPWNLIQALVSGVIYILIGLALDKMKVKERVLRL